tara:strand:- start:467 stop:601 length:135 start_codon:yes stop_codon:yes gene_type:complete
MMRRFQDSALTTGQLMGFDVIARNPSGNKGKLKRLKIIHLMEYA